MENVSVQVRDSHDSGDLIITVAEGDGTRWLPKYFIVVKRDDYGVMTVVCERHKGAKNDVDEI